MDKKQYIKNWYEHLTDEQKLNIKNSRKKYNKKLANKKIKCDICNKIYNGNTIYQHRKTKSHKLKSLNKDFNTSIKNIVNK